MKVFISYSHSDKQYSKLVSNFLAKCGITPILDEWTFRESNPLTEEVCGAIAASDAFVLLWSRKSSGSNYVRFERNLAAARRIKEEDYGFHLIRLDDTPVPEDHAFLLHHDWRRGKPGTKMFEDHLRSLVRAVLGVSRRVPLKVGTNPKILLILAGPSGIGKDVIIHRLCLRLESEGHPVIPLTRYTTRPLRPGEETGGPMVSLSYDAFYQRWRIGEIACVHTSFGNSYGCDSTFAEKAPPGTIILQSMRNLVVLEEMQRLAAENGRIVKTILLKADTDTLQARIQQRTASSEEKDKRTATAHSDVSWIRKNPKRIKSTFDLVVINSDSTPIRRTVGQIEKYLLNCL